MNNTNFIVKKRLIEMGVEKIENPLKIEKGIPIPTSKTGGPNSEFRSLIKQMKPGDSILFNKYDRANYASSVIRKLGWKSTVRIVSGNMEDGEYRVWRIE